jgi:hypothetical protein
VRGLTSIDNTIDAAVRELTNRVELRASDFAELDFAEKRQHDPKNTIAELFTADFSAAEGFGRVVRRSFIHKARVVC